MNMDDKEKQLLVLKQFAMVWNYNAHVEHQHFHFNENVYPTGKGSRCFVACQLKFFDKTKFGSEEGQQRLVSLLERTAARIDTNSGRGWFCIYAGYRYYQGLLALKDGYTDFFTDIENLLQGKLTKLSTGKVNPRERYHNYAQLLGREVNAWYMDKGKLPPMNEMTIWKNRFGGDKSRYERHCLIIKDVYNGLREI